eukprot:7414664-Pyramimonas_sp.AAC.1
MHAADAHVVQDEVGRELGERARARLHAFAFQPAPYASVPRLDGSDVHSGYGSVRPKLTHRTWTQLCTVGVKPVPFHEPLAPIIHAAGRHR